MGYFFCRVKGCITSHKSSTLIDELAHYSNIIVTLSWYRAFFRQHKTGLFSGTFYFNMPFKNICYQFILKSPIIKECRARRVSGSNPASDRDLYLIY